MVKHIIEFTDDEIISLLNLVDKVAVIDLKDEDTVEDLMLIDKLLLDNGFIRSLKV